MRKSLFILMVLFPLITQAQYNFQIIGGRASVLLPDGQMVGLNQNALVGYYLNGNNYVQTTELTLKMSFTTINVSGTNATSKEDAVLKINTLISSVSSGTSSGGGGSSTTPVTAVTKTTGYLNVTTSGTITTGASFISILNVGTASGTVKGIVFPVGASLTFPASYGEINDAVTYDATGTNFLIGTRR